MYSAFRRPHTSEIYVSTGPKTQTLFDMQKEDNHPMSIQHTLDGRLQDGFPDFGSIHYSLLNLLHHS